jgi:hypothetical protein
MSCTSTVRSSITWLGIGVGLLLIVGAPPAAFGKGKRRKGAASAEAAAPAPAVPEPEAAAPAPAEDAPPPAPTRHVPAPTVSADGRISYGPAGPGTGSVTIKGNNIQVTFDGHDFGSSPLTIHDVPRGDYVVEGTAPGGRYVSQPVTIDENVEATVDLQARLVDLTPQVTGGVDRGPFRVPLASKILLGVAAGAFTVGAVYGVLEMKAHSNYESATSQSGLDNFSRTGGRDALIANVGFLSCGASILASGVVALPALLRSRSERPAPVPSAVVVANGGRVTAVAGVSMSF